MIAFPQSDLRWAIHSAAALLSFSAAGSPPQRLRRLCISASAGDGRTTPKPSVCTADELHYVPLPNNEWNLALWRYLPSSQRSRRNHPLLLLSGVGTNAIGYDLAPGSSFARHMSGQGFDTWILEVRGAGLSAKNSLKDPRQGLRDAAQVSSITSQLRDFCNRLGEIIDESQQPITQFTGLQNRFSITLGDFWKQLHLIGKYNWDFDHYLEEDVPIAMDYIRNQSRPKDGKLLAIGHSMGGYRGKNTELASVITLGSSLDYTTSRSSMKMLIPFVDPAKAVNLPVVPVGALLTAIYPLASYPPYLLSWLNPQISAQNMMHPELFERLVLKNFCTIPAKLLSQLSTAFGKGGLRNRSGTFFYKDHLHKTNVPVLALAGDKDLICPPEAVYETVKLIPENLATYKVFGEPRGPHYAHYDLVGGRMCKCHATVGEAEPLVLHPVCGIMRWM
uniref:AB hydrolase-1 domain-containing protein n=1 Tax=Solanum tuberosum TaxID=4113 RepID=M1A487_SOLTU